MEKLHKPVSQEAELWCEPRYIVEQGTPAGNILETAEKLSAALIVVGAQPSNWPATHLNGGTVHNVVAQAKCPVLTVRG